MIFPPLWKRYLFVKTALRCALFLFLFYFLYLLIDVSIHLQQVSNSLGLFSTSLYLYYGYIFSQMADLFIPLSFLLATLSTLFHLSTHRELLAFQVSGLGKRNLFAPFFFLSLLCMALMYTNEQWVRPKSVKFIDAIESSYLKNKPKKSQTKAIHSYPISDTAKVIFSSFSSDDKSLVDTFYIKDNKTIYHTKKLFLVPTYSQGISVDKFEQNDEGHFIKTKSYDSYTFLSLKVDPHLIDVKITPVEHLSLTSLFDFSFSQDALPLFPLPQIKTHFFYKCFMPLTLPLLLLFIFPICTTFSRKKPTLLITALSIFCFVVFYILQNASLILGENSMLPPLVAISLTPVFFITLYALVLLQSALKFLTKKRA